MNAEERIRDAIEATRSLQLALGAALHGVEAGEVEDVWGYAVEMLDRCALVARAVRDAAALLAERQS